MHLLRAVINQWAAGGMNLDLPPFLAQPVSLSEKYSVWKT
jgi:hypothetical protein